MACDKPDILHKASKNKPIKKGRKMPKNKEVVDDSKESLIVPTTNKIKPDKLQEILLRIKSESGNKNTTKKKSRKKASK